MTTKVLSIRLPLDLAISLQSKAKAARSSANAVLRRAAEDYVAAHKTAGNTMQEHIAARAGKWDGYCSGEELLRKTRP
jgi:predicted transcriptional regulator